MSWLLGRWTQFTKWIFSSNSLQRFAALTKDILRWFCDDVPHLLRNSIRTEAPTPAANRKDFVDFISSLETKIKFSLSSPAGLSAVTMKLQYLWATLDYVSTHNLPQLINFSHNPRCLFFFSPHNLHSRARDSWSTKVMRWSTYLPPNISPASMSCSTAIR